MSNYRRSLVPGGTFFFTITLADRHASTLVDHIDHLRTVYANVQRKRPFHTEAICILPEHLHAIWTMPPDDTDYPLRWNLIKAGFSRALPFVESRSASKAGKREKGIWQRRYWEHQIRDAADLQRHVGYIHANPLKHDLVTHVKDWPHSSFHRFVARGDLHADWAGASMDGNNHGE